MQYGKLIRGVLYKAPHQLTDNGCLYGGPPHEVYLKYGYKPVAYTSPIEDIPYGKTLQMYWTETDDQIIQSWKLIALEEDYAELLRKAKGRFNLTMLSLKRSMDEYNQSKNSEAQATLDNNPLLKAGYDCLCAQFPEKSFVDIMREYSKSFPCDFFTEIKFKDFLISRGYTINGGNSQFISLNPFTCYSETDIPNFQNSDGQLYHSETRQQIFIIPPFSAYKVKDQNSLELIDPAFFCFGLQHIAETLRSAHAPCIQFTMGLIYLHTVVDEFINSLMSFYIRSFPEGCDLSNPTTAKDILTATDLSSLQEEIVEKTINDFGYKSYREKIEYLKKRGIICTLPQDQWLDKMIWFCECRNAVVHNSGIINHSIYERMAKTKLKDSVHISDDVNPSYYDFCNDYDLVEAVCNSLYEVAKTKFHF